jgi:hypothetical protein
MATNDESDGIILRNNAFDLQEHLFPRGSLDYSERSTHYAVFVANRYANTLCPRIEAMIRPAEIPLRGL